MAKLPLAEARSMVQLLHEVSDNILTATDDSYPERLELLTGALRELRFFRTVLEDAVRDGDTAAPELSQEGAVLDGEVDADFESFDTHNGDFGAGDVE
jgi:hypothetical protein